MADDLADRVRDRREAAARRLRDLERRSGELAERLARLRAGEPSSPASVQDAEVAARRAVEHAAVAHQAASLAHDHSADRHQEAADLAASLGRTEDAERHRIAAAAAHDAAHRSRAAPS